MRQVMQTIREHACLTTPSQAFLTTTVRRAPRDAKLTTRLQQQQLNIQHGAKNQGPRHNATREMHPTTSKDNKIEYSSPQRKNSSASTAWCNAAKLNNLIGKTFALAHQHAWKPSVALRYSAKVFVGLSPAFKRNEKEAERGAYV